MIKGIIGTVIGDIAGSTHEGKPVKTMRFDTLNKQSTVTDDTVLTMAVAEWMLDRKNVSVSDSLIKWATLYPHAGYGSSFKRFLADTAIIDHIITFTFVDSLKHVCGPVVRMNY